MFTQEHWEHNTKSYLQIFFKNLFITAKTWKQLKCLAIDDGSSGKCVQWNATQQSKGTNYWHTKWCEWISKAVS